LEILVVDDASTEDITPLVREMGVRYHRLEENQGPAIARTVGAKMATGQVVLFTDADVWLPEGLLQGVLQTFLDRDCECVQGTFSRQCPYANYFSQYKNLYNRYVLNQLPEWIQTTFTSLTAIRRDFFFSCGGFDENIHQASIEDRTLGENIIRAGGRIFLNKDLEVIHNKHLGWKTFLRNQFLRSRDLAKLLLRQKESGFLSKPPHHPGEASQEKTAGQTSTFGTNSKTTMLRLPFAGLALFLGVVGMMTTGSLAIILITLSLGAFLAYLVCASRWIRYLTSEKGKWFALRGVSVDYLDALVSGVGVATGMIQYKILGRRY
jgi:hypothetical protein